MSGPEKVDSDLYSTDEFTKEAIKFLWQRQSAGTPFTSQSFKIAYRRACGDYSKILIFDYNLLG